MAGGAAKLIQITVGKDHHFAYLATIGRIIRNRGHFARNTSRAA